MSVDGTKLRAGQSLAPVLVLFFGLVVVSGPVRADAPTDAASISRVWPDNLYGVDFFDERTGWISGYAGTVVRTTDGGASWELVYIGRNELIRRIRFVDADTGWAVGHRGSIFHSRDGGVTWKVQYEQSGIYLRDVDFADRNTGWVVGHDGKILHTRDSGESWSEQQITGYTGRDIPRLHGIRAIDTDTAVLVGEFGVIGRTFDGGASWTLVPNASKTTLLAVERAGKKGIAVGLDGAIFSFPLDPDAAVGETSATPIESGSKNHFFDLAVVPGGGVIAVGRSILVHIDRGTVRHIPADDAIQLRYAWFGGVDASSDGRVWAAGIRGAVISAEKSGAPFKPSLSLGLSSSVTRLSGRWDAPR